MSVHFTIDSLNLTVGHGMAAEILRLCHGASSGAYVGIFVNCIYERRLEWAANDVGLA